MNINSKARWMLSSAAVLFGAGFCGNAFAQDVETVAAQPAPAPESAEATDGGGGDIIVTARRRDESLLRVPVAVSVVGSEQLTRGSADSLSKIGELTPTVIVGSYKAGSGGSIAIRGISSAAQQFGFEQSVSVAVDGVQLSNGRLSTLSFFDLAQVEVLKGPQALFFGKNSPAGVISVTSSAPTNSFEARLRAGYEFVADEYTLEGVVSGPITETLKARLAVRYRDAKGWMYNDARPIANPFYTPAQPAGAAQLPGAISSRVGDSDLLGRLTLQYEPSQVVTASLRVFGARGKDQGNGLGSQVIGPCVGGQPHAFGVVDPFGECRPDNRLTNAARPAAIAQTFPRAPADGKNRGRVNAIVASLNVEAAWEPATLTSTTAYSRISNFSWSGTEQSSFSVVPVLDDTSSRSLSQEIRLLTNSEGPLNVMVGGFFQDTRDVIYNDVATLDSLTYNPAANRYSAYEKLGSTDGRTYSIFGQLIYKIGEVAEIAGGARYTRERKYMSSRNLYGFDSAAGQYDTLDTIYPSSVDQTPGVLAGRFSDSNISPEATISFYPSQDATIYIAYKSGFKSGGYGLTTFQQISSTLADFDFGSERSTGFELGAKAELLDRRLSLNASLFAYRFKDLQVNTYDATVLRYSIDNAGAVRQRGADIEARFRASRNFSLRGALSYVDNKFENYTGQCYGYTIPAAQALTADAPPNCVFRLNPDGSRFLTPAGGVVLEQVFDGRAPARSPKWSGSAGFLLTGDVSNDLIFELSGDAFYSSGYYASETMAPSTYQDDFWRLNASLRIAQSAEKWDVSLIGRNLTNKYYLLYATDRTGGTSIPLTVGEQRGVVARGREIMLQTTFRF